MKTTADLLDINVWLALTIAGHPHHSISMKAWKTVRRPVFCRITQMGFLRLLCNKHVMGPDILHPASAWAKYEQLMASGAVEFMEDPSNLEACLKPNLINSHADSGFWTDAWLAAFATAANLRLVTFDAGFRHFKNLDCLILK